MTHDEFLEFRRKAHQHTFEIGETMSDLWPGVPRELYLCSNAQQFGTTAERLMLHLILDHGVELPYVIQRGQVELENMHDAEHAKDHCSHRHSLPVRIVGYDIGKDEQITIGAPQPAAR